MTRYLHLYPFISVLCTVVDVNPLSANPITQNGQTHSNNSSAVADELFEYV